MRTTIQRGMTLIEILVVVAIIVTLMGLLLTGISVLRKRTTERMVTTTLARLHLGLETLILEHGVPKDAATGFDGTPYLDMDPVDLGAGVTTHSVAGRLADRGLLSFVGERDLDQENRLRDPWGQPYLFVIGDEVDPNGHQPQAVAAARPEWVVVNAEADPAYRIYVYSYGRGNQTGKDTDAWLVFGGDY